MGRKDVSLRVGIKQLVEQQDANKFRTCVCVHYNVFKGAKCIRVLVSVTLKQCSFVK